MAPAYQIVDEMELTQMSMLHFKCSKHEISVANNRAYYLFLISKRRIIKSKLP